MGSGRVVAPPLARGSGGTDHLGTKLEELGGQAASVSDQYVPAVAKQLEDELGYGFGEDRVVAAAVNVLAALDPSVLKAHSQHLCGREEKIKKCATMSGAVGSAASALLPYIE